MQELTVRPRGAVAPSPPPPKYATDLIHYERVVVSHCIQSYPQIVVVILSLHLVQL